jgi:hypothetical protein
VQEWGEEAEVAGPVAGWLEEQREAAAHPSQARVKVVVTPRGPAAGVAAAGVAAGMVGYYAAAAAAAEPALVEFYKTGHGCSNVNTAE